MATKDYPANVKLYKGPLEKLESKSFNNVAVNKELLSLIDQKLGEGWRLEREPPKAKAPAPAPVAVPVAPSGASKR